MSFGPNRGSARQNVLTVGRAFIFGLWISASIGVTLSSVQSAPPAAPAAMFDKYCVSCHNQRLRTAGFAIDNLDSAHPATNPEAWEKVIAKLRAGSMPPPGRPRPDPATYRAVASALEHDIDRAWLAKPNPGRINAVHRLNRTEYNNAIRDLFALDVDVKPLLPGDETADGSFDNMADALSISTAHLERYMSVARQVTRLATGLPPARPTVETFEIPLHVMQDERQSEDLPFGSRGGMAIRRDFPSDGEYAIKVRLQRQYQDYIKGMGWPQQLDVRLDHKLLKRFTVGGEAKGRPAASSYAGDGEPGFAGDDSWEKYMQIGGDAELEVRVPVAAGPHVVGVAFVRQLWEPEGLPQPLQRGRVITDDQVYMGYASVGSVQIGGPYKPRDQYVVSGFSRTTTAPPIVARCSRVSRRPSQKRRRAPPGSCREWRGWRTAAPPRPRTCRRFSSFSTPAVMRAAALTPAFSSRSSGCSWTLTFCSAFTRPPSRRRFRRRFGETGLRRHGRSARPRNRVAAVIFPVGQHPRRSTADARRARPADESVNAGKGSPPDAGRPARQRIARQRFRRTVVEPAPRRRGRRRPGAVSQLRPQSSAGIPARDGALCRQHDPRGSQRRLVC